MSSYNLGAFRINPRGEFNPEYEYKFLDAVSYKGGSYLCINEDLIDGVSNKGILPVGEEKSSAYYMVLASPGAKGDKADKYDSFINLYSTDWDYNLSDKIKIPSTVTLNSRLNIMNVYDGCCGMVIYDKDLKLPSNSETPVDYDVIEARANQYYVYTFVYVAENDVDGKFIWNRAVYDYGE